MINNLTITEKAPEQIKLDKRRGYLLVASNVYGETYMPDYPEVVSKEQARKKSKMLLSEIDHITASCHDEEELLRKYDLYDFKTPTKVNIEYSHKGIIKSLPIVYNDELLVRIAKESDIRVVQNADTDKVFQRLKIQLSENKHSLINKLLYYGEIVTDPVIRAILMKGLISKNSEVNFEQLHHEVHSHYKQWRAIYNHVKVKK